MFENLHFIMKIFSIHEKFKLIFISVTSFEVSRKISLFAEIQFDCTDWKSKCKVGVDEVKVVRSSNGGLETWLPTDYKPIGQRGM